jgi:hypothetical protein
MENSEEKREELKLAQKVADKFDLVGVKPGKHRFPQYGEIDLTKLTLEDATILVQAGFPYFREKGEVKAEEVIETSGKNLARPELTSVKEKIKEEDTAPAAPVKTK